MSIRETELIQQIETIAPRNLEEPWDNSGRQINMGKEDIDSVLIALDITREVIEEARQLRVDYVITHHPLLFHKLDVIDNNTITGNHIIELIRAGISVYTAHTPFDEAFGGNNDYLAELLGLRKIRKFQAPRLQPELEIPGRIGDLDEPQRLADVCALVRRNLRIERNIKVVGHPDDLIRKIGLCTGAGGSVINDAVRNACDVLITGDVKYHDARFAEESGIALIDAGHYETEWIFTDNFADQLARITGGRLTIHKSKINVDPFSFMA